MNLASVGARRPIVVAVVVMALVVAGCGSSASPAAASPSAAPTPTATSTPSPTPTPTPSPSASVAPSVTPIDAAADLKIGTPYALAPMPASMSDLFQTQFKSTAGAFGDKVSFGFREVTGGKGLVFLIVMRFPTGTLNDVVMGAMTGAMSSAMKTTLTKTSVSGKEVDSGSYQGGELALYHDGDDLFFVIAIVKNEAVSVATSLIGAN